MTRPNPWPSKDSQQERLLKGLLAGDKITNISAIVDYNCPMINARCSELRKMGWPIRTLTIPHPNQTKFPNATLPVYVIDAHFRQWAVDSLEGTHPYDYQFTDGRGKFADQVIKGEA